MMIIVDGNSDIGAHVYREIDSRSKFEIKEKLFPS